MIDQIKTHLQYHRFGSDNVSRDYCLDVKWLLQRVEELEKELAWWVNRHAPK